MSKYLLKPSNENVNSVSIGSENEGAFDSSLVEVESFEVGNTLTQIDQVYSHESPPGMPSSIDGIVGMDVFKSTSALVDLKRNQLILFDTKASQQDYVSTHLGQRCPIQVSGLGLPLIEAVLGDKNVYWVLDSGAGHSVVDQSFAMENQYQSSNHPNAKMLNHSGEEVPLQYLPNNHLSVCKKKITSDFFVSDFAAIKSMVQPELDKPLAGVLGRHELTQLGAVLDPTTSTLFFVNEDSNKFEVTE